ncbi:MAG TPA: ABC transporter ATP-binding protein/permease [Candidatus Binatia bacterium]|nr:ABC transporter ATP-binding protein/permease [Candidatus Binatia bacterium]
MPTEAEDRRTRQYLLALFWDAALGFWRKGAGSTAWILTVTLVAIILVNLGIQYRLNVWYRTMFDAIDHKDGGGVVRQSLIFIPLMFANVAIAAAATYARLTTQRRWREWLNGNVLDRWLSRGRYYQLNLIPGDHQNPEYRVAEDLRVACDAPVDFGVGIVSAALSAATFIGVLWYIGGTLDLAVGGATIRIPGFLVIAAVIYAVLASGSMAIIGRRFVVVSEAKNQAEAEYRYALTRLRENGESIAILGGENEERAGLDTAFSGVVARWRDLMIQHLRTTTVSQTSAGFVPVIPLLLCAPKYVAGTMTLGQVMQASSAFVTVQVAFNWLVDNYPRLADWTASARRLASLLASLQRLERADREETSGRIVRRETEGAALRLRNLSVTLDDGSAVVNEADVEIARGEKVLVVGESGTGKSTLVRAISGLWPWGEGEILIQSAARLFLMPQQSYVPLGTLRRAATYPLPPEEVEDDVLRKTLEEVGLGHFLDRLDEDARWEDILSGGEKQRLAFARILVDRPDIVVMDEATAALDPGSQERLMKLVLERLPEATIVSVGHRAELEAFHSRRLVLEYHPEGARLVRDESLESGFRRPARFLSRLLTREKPFRPAPAT